ncbi:MAG: Hsp20 family protein [Peptoniphilaceae bacterium]|nr:Hsp20 family protein [Peptoniphilaceae bacterium]MDY6085422.1 Hsp20 family protein [Peptoniphilaceae bacterium]
MKLVPYTESPLYRNMHLMNDLMDEMMGMRSSNTVSFRLDLEKADDRYIVTAELPGLKKEDINLDVEDGVMTIGVHKVEEREEKQEEKHYLHRERREINAERQIDVGAVDEENIKATLEDGVLRVELPFVNEVEKKKAISID